MTDRCQQCQDRKVRHQVGSDYDQWVFVDPETNKVVLTHHECQKKEHNAPSL